MVNDLNKQVESPKGILKVFFKLPVLAYRTGTGFLLGKRFIYVEHVGRKSGLKRRSVLEVVRYDKDEDIYYIASGYGTKSDWYKNIKATPNVKIQVGFRKSNAKVEFLSEERNEEEIRDYARRHPTAIKQLAKLIGYKLKGEEGELSRLSKLWPVIAFHPEST